MLDSLKDTTYNPDVLSCIANLSNDEVFTPPDVVNQMLDMLPNKLWSDKSVTFLDPACKSGVFLREIAKRLIEGLKNEIPNLQERIDHIFHKQLFGIAITELTSLLSRRSVYCSKYPNSKFSISFFENISGNVRFRRVEHKWLRERCVFCGASIDQFDRDTSLETHAYEFIHTLKLKEIFDMKFDVIIGNPPYQLNDGGGKGTSAKPIYQHFVMQAQKLNPRYLSMIIPARWFSGGKGLDSFRQKMLTDRRIRKLVDYDNFKDVFPGVDLAGGACYFLWDRDNEGACEVTNHSGKFVTTSQRYLDEFDVFVRQNYAVSIVKKIIEANNKGGFLNEIVSSRMPFGISSTYIPIDHGVPCHFTQKIGVKHVALSDVVDNAKILNKWKLLVPKAPIAGQTDFSKPVTFFYDGNTRIAKPGECCSESWLVIASFSTEDETLSFKSYLFTKTVRFLLLQTVVSQNITKKNFAFIPNLLKYSGEYTDKQLVDLWSITQEEWQYIDSKISSAGDSDGK
jgi:site-specific DNA-methyltransferase (adenine-specific)